MNFVCHPCAAFANQVTDYSTTHLLNNCNSFFPVLTWADLQIIIWFTYIFRVLISSKSMQCSCIPDDLCVTLLTQVDRGQTYWHRKVNTVTIQREHRGTSEAKHVRRQTRLNADKWLTIQEWQCSFMYKAGKWQDTGGDKWNNRGSRQQWRRTGMTKQTGKRCKNQGSKPQTNKNKQAKNRSWHLEF